MEPCSRFHRKNCFPKFCKIYWFWIQLGSSYRNRVASSRKLFLIPVNLPDLSRQLGPGYGTVFPVPQKLFSQLLQNLLIPSRQLGPSYRNRVPSSKEIVFPIPVNLPDLSRQLGPGYGTVFPVPRKLFSQFLQNLLIPNTARIQLKKLCSQFTEIVFLNSQL